MREYGLFFLFAIIVEKGNRMEEGVEEMAHIAQPLSSSTDIE